MELWINPSCSKCTSALEELQAADVEFEQRRYLDQPPTEDELTEVLRRLRLDPWDVTRLDEATAVQLGMRDWPLDRQRWIRALVEHPELIQRPILLLDDGTATLGRDADAVRVAVRRSSAG
jgi:arsenate reductase